MGYTVWFVQGKELKGNINEKWNFDFDCVWKVNSLVLV